jgi:hypothetical protein
VGPAAAGIGSRRATSVGVVGTYMWRVVGPLLVLMQVLVLARARLLLHGLLDIEL